MAKNDKATEQRGIRFTPEQMRALEAEAERRSADGVNVTVSDIVRMLVTVHLIKGKK